MIVPTVRLEDLLGRAGEDHASEKALRAFIAAPPSASTSTIREELHKRGVASYELDEVGGAGRPLTEILDVCVRRADLVVAVLGSPKDGALGEERVLIELGYALALKKRILVIVPPEGDLPIEPLPYLRTRPENREAIAFGLDQVLSAPAAGTRTTKGESPRTRPLGAEADRLFRQLETPGQGDEQALAGVVQEALSASGVSACERAKGAGAANGRVAFAIWAEDFEPWLGNPFLLEVRGCLADEADLERALGQMAAWLEKTHTAWGLLLHNGPEVGSATEAVRYPRIFVLTVGRFLEALRQTSLGDLLQEMRRRRVHGRVGCLPSRAPPSGGS